ncbi:hypothetical protein K9L67_01880 [Candidatus Woesearchaeota archaeon]|nr:hypothetical protein [Candidatus Woesearchaeota archaeon]MCF7900953.1 hypothetical protein [Candidatus Woesearchaeota archaeon]MCF8013601.1 hypothetical protein [Candidatus Woesearchaeota archaeon]
MKKTIIGILILTMMILTACNTNLGGCNNDGFCSLEEQLGNCGDCMPDFEVTDDDIRVYTDYENNIREVGVCVTNKNGQYEGPVSIGFSKIDANGYESEWEDEEVRFTSDYAEGDFELGTRGKQIEFDFNFIMGDDEEYDCFYYEFDLVESDAYYLFRINYDRNVEELDYKNNYASIFIDVEEHYPEYLIEENIGNFEYYGSSKYGSEYNAYYNGGSLTMYLINSNLEAKRYFEYMVEYYSSPESVENGYAIELINVGNKYFAKLINDVSNGRYGKYFWYSDNKFIQVYFDNEDTALFEAYAKRYPSDVVGENTPDLLFAEPKVEVSINYGLDNSTVQNYEVSTCFANATNITYDNSLAKYQFKNENGMCKSYTVDCQKANELVVNVAPLEKVEAPLVKGQAAQLYGEKILLTSVGSTSVRVVIGNESQVIADGDSEKFDSGTIVEVEKGSIFYEEDMPDNAATLLISSGVVLASYEKDVSKNKCASSVEVTEPEENKVTVELKKGDVFKYGDSEITYMNSYQEAAGAAGKTKITVDGETKELLVGEYANFNYKTEVYLDSVKFSTDTKKTCDKYAIVDIYSSLGSLEVENYKLTEKNSYSFVDDSDISIVVKALLSELGDEVEINVNSQKITMKKGDSETFSKGVDILVKETFSECEYRDEDYPINANSDSEATIIVTDAPCEIKNTQTYKNPKATYNGRESDICSDSVSVNQFCIDKGYNVGTIVKSIGGGNNGLLYKNSIWTLSSCTYTSLNCMVVECMPKKVGGLKSMYDELTGDSEVEIHDEGNRGSLGDCGFNNCYGGGGGDQNS